VLVEGQVLMEDRRVLTVDETEILERAQAEALHTVDVFGLRPLMEPSAHHWGHSTE
jgi:5-methylthioadenosine/S-adenosylhomocysteine deaminase